MKVTACARFELDELRTELSTLRQILSFVTSEPEEFLNNLAGSDILVFMNELYSEELARRLRVEAPSVKLIQLLTAGFDKLEKFGVPQNVTVATAGDSRSAAVAEHVIALMLALCECLPEAADLQARKHWDEQFKRTVGTLIGQRLLIVGLGSIGTEIALRAKPFGMSIVGINRSGISPVEGVQAIAAAELHAALPEADFIVIALPSEASTRRLIGEREFGLMKKGAFLVNVARGDILDQNALLAALSDGVVAGAALDVVEGEPLNSDSLLWTAPNLILTPHMGGFAGETGRKCLARNVAENLRRYVEGEQLKWTASVRLTPGT